MCVIEYLLDQNLAVMNDKNCNKKTVRNSYSFLLVLQTNNVFEAFPDSNEELLDAVKEPV